MASFVPTRASVGGARHPGVRCSAPRCLQRPSAACARADGLVSAVLAACKSVRHFHGGRCPLHQESALKHNCLSTHALLAGQRAVGSAGTANVRSPNVCKGCTAAGFPNRDLLDPEARQEGMLAAATHQRGGERQCELGQFEHRS